MMIALDVNEVALHILYIPCIVGWYVCMNVFPASLIW